MGVRMRTFFSEARVQWAGTFWSAFVIIGLFTTTWVRVLPSVAMGGLLATGLVYGFAQQRIAQRAHWPAVLSFVLVYALHLVTGRLHVGWDDKILQQDLVLQLPFLVLPLAFWLLPAWRPAHQRFLWLLLIGCCSVVAVGATANYLLHRAAIDRLYLESQVMPTVPDHIRFSLLLSMAVVAGIGLVFTEKLSVGLRRAVLGAVVLLAVFQHLLAVRSGLATMYAAGLLGLGWWGWQGRWRALLAGVVVAAALGGTCLLLFPTLRNKVVDTRADAAQLHSEWAANYYSVTARVYSFEVAWAIVREHPVGGVGKVKLEAAMARQYAYRFPAISAEHYLLPHNQFLYNLAAYGAVGLLVFMAGFYYPLWAGRRKLLLVLLYLIVSISFTVEYTLETQIGVLTGLFFILLAAAAAQAEPEAAPLPRRLAKIDA